MYKVTNPFNQPIKVENMIFQPGETKVMPSKIDGFYNEEIEEREKPKITKRR